MHRAKAVATACDGLTLLLLMLLIVLLLTIEANSLSSARTEVAACQLEKLWQDKCLSDLAQRNAFRSFA